MATDENYAELVESILYIKSTMEYPLLLLNMYSAVYDDIVHSREGHIQLCGTLEIRLT